MLHKNKSDFLLYHFGSALCRASHAPFSLSVCASPRGQYLLRRELLPLGAMDARNWLVFVAVLLATAPLAQGLFEDQVGMWDWYVCSMRLVLKL